MLALAAATPLPGASPLACTQHDRVSAERALAQVRPQVAIVLTLADLVARMAHSTAAEGLCRQLLEEVTRLRERVALAAASMDERERGESGLFPTAVAALHAVMSR